MMWLGQTVYPETPAWLLAPTSFILAVAAVAVGEVAVTEGRYKLMRRKLRRSGFGEEGYFESRFLIKKQVKPGEVIRAVAQEFDLPEPFERKYHDKYFRTSLPQFNGRIPKLRLRQRDRREGGQYQSAQIVYTKASEMAKRHPEQFNYFPQRKEKMYFVFEDHMPWDIPEIPDRSVRSIVKRATKRDGTRNELTFVRTSANTPETLYVSSDEVHRGEHRPFYVVELKTYEDTDLLKQAMRFVMDNFPVAQTTAGKLELSLMNGS
jgi:hypothetical protein